jgi:hypothetical protein
MNMPFELGIEYGSRLFGSRRLQNKRCLILEETRYEFMKALSDLSGVDIKSHNNNPINIIRAVRDWFVETVDLRDISSPTVIWGHFTDFTYFFYNKRNAEGFTDEDLKMMPVAEYINYIRKWISDWKITNR